MSTPVSSGEQEDSGPVKKKLDLILDMNADDRLKEARSMALRNSRKVQGLLTQVDRLREIDLHQRVFVREGDMIKIGAGGKKVQERRFYLFDNVLVWAKANILRRKYSYIVRNVIYMADLLVADADDTPKFQDLIKVTNVSNGKEYLLMADSPNMKRKWLRDLRSVKARRHPGVAIIQSIYKRSIQPNELHVAGPIRGQESDDDSPDRDSRGSGSGDSPGTSAEGDGLRALRARLASPADRSSFGDVESELSTTTATPPSRAKSHLGGVSPSTARPRSLPPTDAAVASSTSLSPVRSFERSQDTAHSHTGSGPVLEGPPPLSPTPHDSPLTLTDYYRETGTFTLDSDSDDELDAAVVASAPAPPTASAPTRPAKRPPPKPSTPPVAPSAFPEPDESGSAMDLLQAEIIDSEATGARSALHSLESLINSSVVDKMALRDELRDTLTAFQALAQVLDSENATIVRRLAALLVKSCKDGLAASADDPAAWATSHKVIHAALSRIAPFIRH